MCECVCEFRKILGKDRYSGIHHRCHYDSLHGRMAATIRSRGYVTKY